MVALFFGVFGAFYALAAFTIGLRDLGSRPHAAVFFALSLSSCLYTLGYFGLLYPDPSTIKQVLEIHMLLGFLLVALPIPCLMIYLPRESHALNLIVRILAVIIGLYGLFLILGALGGFSFLIQDRSGAVEQLIANEIASNYEPSRIASLSHLASRVIVVCTLIYILVKFRSGLTRYVKAIIYSSIVIVTHNLLSMHGFIEMYLPSLVFLNGLLIVNYFRTAR